MTVYSLLPLLGIAGFGVFILLTATGARPLPVAWSLPAALGLAFLAFSLVTIAAEGPLGFWANHSQDFWGNQVWLDLLLALGIALSLLVPQAREVGMRPLPWLLLVCMTGSIGVLAMYARLLYLRDRTPQTVQA